MQMWKTFLYLFRPSYFSNLVFKCECNGSLWQLFYFFDLLYFFHFPLSIHHQFSIIDCFLTSSIQLTFFYLSMEKKLNQIEIKLARFLSIGGISTNIFFIVAPSWEWLNKWIIASSPSISLWLLLSGILFEICSTKLKWKDTLKPCPAYLSSIINVVVFHVCLKPT